MAGYKETPRQKMIGMMYLVLTALLALNVSKDILNAFVVVNGGLEKTTEILQKKNALLINEIEAAKAMDEAKVGPFLDQALKAKSYTDDLVNYITDLKREVIAYTEFGDKSLQEVDYDHVTLVDGKKVKEKRTVKVAEFPLAYIGKKDNYDKPMEILIGQSHDGSAGKSRELKEKLLKFKSDMINLVPEERRKNVDLGFDDLEEELFVKEIGKKLNWEMRTFYHTVLSADVILFNKLITEVLNVQAEVTTEIMGDISRRDFKFDKIEAKLVPNSNIILSGSEYIADIFVAAYSQTQTPEVYIKEGADELLESQIGTATKIEGDSGVVRYRTVASGAGERKYAGLVKVQKPDGSDEFFHFKHAYNVQPPAATVAADRMNVFYRGLDNPISVSVPGVSGNNISISVSGATYSGGAGKYLIKPGTGGEAKVNVIANVGGRSVAMGSFPFRIKPLPPAIPKIANISAGSASKAIIVNSPYVVASLEDFLFDGVNYRVASFSVSTIRGIATVREPVTGNRLSAKAIDNIRQAPTGSKLIIDEIRAITPDGRPMILPAIVITLQ